MNKIIFFLAVLLIFPAMPLAGNKDDGRPPLPRFVSTNSGEINVRTGPGVRYPIKWVLVKENMPLEVIADYEDWRKVRDIEQAEGWIHKAMLSGRRTALVKENNKNIYRKPDEGSQVVAVANKGTILRVKKCDGVFCEISAGRSVDGNIKMQDIWGVYENERFKK